MAFWDKVITRDKGKESKNDAISSAYVGGQYAAAVTINEQQATDEMIRGMELFQEMVARVGNKLPHMRRGHLFEAIIAAKQNACHASQGSVVRAQITHLQGEHTSPADLRYYQNDLLIGEAQAKFSVQSPSKIVSMITDSKYTGMERCIPANKIKEVGEELTRRIHETNDPEQLSQLKDALVRLNKQHDTTTTEVRYADRHPIKYAAKLEFDYAAKEIATSGYQAAAAAAIIGGGISILKNIVAAYDERLSTGQALCNIAQDAAKSTVRGGTVGATGAVIRVGAQKAGVQFFAKANVATAVAGAMLEVGGTVYDFATGKITGETAVIRMGQTGTSTVSGLYTGAAAGAVFGPVGAVVGSMVGYMIASSTYQSCIAVLENAKLAETEANRVVALCEAACKAMQEQRDEFEHLLEKRLECKRREFTVIFQGIDSALNSKNFSASVDGMTELAGMFGRKLRLQTFEEFDDFMKNSNEPLRL